MAMTLELQEQTAKLKENLMRAEKETVTAREALQNATSNQQTKEESKEATATKIVQLSYSPAASAMNKAEMAQLSSTVLSLKAEVVDLGVKLADAQAGRLAAQQELIKAEKSRAEI